MSVSKITFTGSRAVSNPAHVSQIPMQSMQRTKRDPQVRRMNPDNLFRIVLLPYEKQTIASVRLGKFTKSYACNFAFVFDNPAIFNGKISYLNCGTLIAHLGQ